MTRFSTSCKISVSYDTLIFNIEVPTVCDFDRIGFILETDLFRGCDTSTAARAVASPLFEVKNCGRGEKISFKGGALGVLEKGKLKVGGRVNRRKLIINTLEKGSVWGFASLFEGDDHFETDIFSAGASVFYVFPEELLLELMAVDKNLSKNIIAMQSQKIRFLNEKILSYTAPSASEKLLRYLGTLEKDAEGDVRLSLGIAPLAARLDIGRASLYRAFRKLENEGKIIKNGEKITVK